MSTITPTGFEYPRDFFFLRGREKKDKKTWELVLDPKMQWVIEILVINLINFIYPK